MPRAFGDVSSAAVVFFWLLGIKLPGIWKKFYCAPSQILTFYLERGRGLCNGKQFLNSSEGIVCLFLWEEGILLSCFLCGIAKDLFPVGKLVPKSCLFPVCFALSPLWKNPIILVST